MGELLLDTGHADEVHRDDGAVVLVAEPLDRVAGEVFGLVDDGVRAALRRVNR